MDNLIPLHASRARLRHRTGGPDPDIAPAAFALGPDGLQRGAAYSPRAAQGLEPLAYDPRRGLRRRVAAPFRARPLTSRALFWQLLLIAGALVAAGVRVRGWPL